MKLNYLKHNPNGDFTVVLIHGFLEDHQMFLPYINYFTQLNAQVLIYDLPGHGDSESSQEPFEITDIASAIEADLETLNAQNVSVLGHSMGGYVALALEEAYPLEKVILLNSTPLADSKWKKEDRLRAIEAMKQNKKLFIKMAIPNLFAEHYRKALKNEINQAIEIANNTEDDAIAHSLLAMRNRPAFDLNFVDAETYLILGAQDNIVPIQKLEEVIHARGVVSFIHPQAGHMTYLEEKQWFLKCLDDIFVS